MRKAILLSLSLVVLGVAAIAQADSTLKPYTGRYIFPVGSATPEAIVSLESGNLTISSSLGSATLSKINADVFSIVEYNGTATFKRNDAGKINAIHVQVADLDLTGTRDESYIWWWRHHLLFKF
jgi:hypothetical protein